MVDDYMQTEESALKLFFDSLSVILTVPLAVFAIINVFYGVWGGETFKFLFDSTAFFPSFFIAAILIAFYYSRDNLVYMWYVVGLDLLYKLIFAMFAGGGWASGFIIFIGLVELIILAIAVLILKKLSDVGITTWKSLGIFALFIVINILQYYY